MEELSKSLREMMATLLDLVAVSVDFVKTVSLSVSALQLLGIILVAFLLGLLFGRITKREAQQAVEESEEREAGRISLNLERLTPLGLSEEAAEHPAMDISDLRPDQTPEGPVESNREKQQEPTPLIKE